MKHILATKLILSYQSLFIISAGILLGLFFLNIANLTNEWIVAIFAAGIISCLALIIGHIKLVFFIFMILAIPLNADINFFWHPEHIGGADSFRVTAVDICLYILLILWSLERISSRKEKISISKEATILPVLLIIISAISLIKAPSLELGALEIIRMCKVFLVYFFVINYVRDSYRFKLSILAILIGLSIQILLGLLQWSFSTTFGLTTLGEDVVLTTHWLKGYGDVPRVGGTIGPSVNFAKYLGLLLPIPFMLLFSKIRGSYKFVCFLILLSGVIVLIMTLTRASWIASLFSFLVIFILAIRKKLLRGNSIIIMIAITLIFLMVMPFTGIIKSRFISEDYGSAYERIPLLKVALAVIKANPILGVGINNYQEVMGKYDKTREHISDIGSPVHNLFLLTAAETGIPGLIIFLWVFFIFIKKMAGCLKSKDQFILLLGIAFLAGFSSLFIQSLTGMGYRQGEIIMTLTWVLGGLAVAASSLDPHKLESKI